MTLLTVFQPVSKLKAQNEITFFFLSLVNPQSNTKPSQPLSRQLNKYTSGICVCNLYIKRCLNQTVGLYHRLSTFLNLCSCVSYLTLSLLQTHKCSLKILILTLTTPRYKGAAASVGVTWTSPVSPLHEGKFTWQFFVLLKITQICFNRLNGWARVLDLIVRGNRPA